MRIANTKPREKKIQENEEKEAWNKEEAIHKMEMKSLLLSLWHTFESIHWYAHIVNILFEIEMWVCG